MEKTQLISVIIPVYKVEPYLRKCVESVLGQTYKHLEIFLVDDGSPDNCGVICDEYAREDSRIKVIHKPNGGLSDARNAAIDRMTGEYVTFIDSDDFVAPGYVETLYKLVQENDVDLAVSQFKHYRSGDNEFISQPLLRETVLNFKDAISTMFYQRMFDTSAWGKIYKKELFSTGIRYPKGLLYEDLPTTYKLFRKAGSIAVTNRQTYYYLLREDSIIGYSFNEKKLDILEISAEMLQVFSTEMPELLPALKCRLLSSYCNIYFQIPAGNPNEALFRKRIFEFRKEVLLNKDARPKARLACLLTYMGMPVVRFVFNYLNRRK